MPITMQAAAGFLPSMWQEKLPASATRPAVHRIAKRAWQAPLIKQAARAESRSRSAVTHAVASITARGAARPPACAWVPVAARSPARKKPSAVPSAVNKTDCCKQQGLSRVNGMPQPASRLLFCNGYFQSVATYIIAYFTEVVFCFLHKFHRPFFPPSVRF